MTITRPSRAATPLALLFAAALCMASGASAYYAGGGKKPENDCLIGYNGIDAADVTIDGKKQSVVCQDCDPACDADGVAEANGSCTFLVGVCLNQSGVEGCTPASGLDKAKATAKVKGQKGKIDIQVPQLLEGSVCGALLELDVAVKETKKGQKDGKGTVSLSASVKPEGEKKRSDSDKLTYVCTPLPAGESCPVPTTTTSTSTTTTTSLPPCGNGVIDSGETCDQTAEPNGCGAGETCINNCTQCVSCVAPGPSDPTSLTFTTGPGTSNCGSVGFNPTPAAAPYGGILKDSTGATLQNLGLGCLYIGGALSTVPGGVTPDGAPSTFAVTQVCDGGNTLVLGGAATGGVDCTVQDGPAKNCANGHPGTDGNGACASDADCRPLCASGQCVNGAPGPGGNGACTVGAQCGTGAEGVAGSDGLICVPVSNCNFGPPLPVKNGPLSTCVFNVFDDDASGTANIPGGAVSLRLPLSSRVHFTSTTYPNGPCPTCQAGVCDGGPNQGQPCTGTGVDGTTYDCPPAEYFFLAPLAVTLDPLTTGTSSVPTDGSVSPDGDFCPGQGDPPLQSASSFGAFGVAAARAIAMTGTPTASPLSSTPQDGVLASAFCIPRTGNIVIDGAANLPGPGATSLGGTLQIQ